VLMQRIRVIGLEVGSTMLAGWEWAYMGM